VAGPDLDAVADELYALHPGEFVTVRDARAKEARAAGDRGTAGLISALRKPTVVAWLSNQLARQHAEHVQPLLELGEALREATATLSGPQLRELSRQRAQLVHALVEEARGVAATAGQRVSEETLRGVEATLHAALADPDAARQLVEGRLSDGLTVSGFGPADESSPAPAKRSAPPSRRAAAKGSAMEDRRAGRRAEVEKELGDAWAEAGGAAEQRDQAEEAGPRGERAARRGRGARRRRVRP
jgi:hypothetical protein